MAAAVFTKNVLLQTRCQQHSLHRFCRRSAKHSVPSPPVSGPKNIGDHPLHHLNQSKRSTILPLSISRKRNELLFSAPTAISSTLSSIGSSSPPKFGFVDWYLGLIKTRPIATQSVTSAIIYIAADLSSQTIAKEASEGYDWMRTLKMAGIGMLIIGPSLHYWFSLASRLFPNRDLMSIIVNVALRQMVYGPTVAATIIFVNAALKGESSPEIIARLKRDMLPTFIRSNIFWPVCDFVTFKFIPLRLQPLVSNLFSYLWTVYLSYIASLRKVRTD